MSGSLPSLSRTRFKLICQENLKSHYKGGILGETKNCAHFKAIFFFHIYWFFISSQYLCFSCVSYNWPYMTGWLVLSTVTKYHRWGLARYTDWFLIALAAGNLESQGQHGHIPERALMSCKWLSSCGTFRWGKNILEFCLYVCVCTYAHTHTYVCVYQARLPFMRTLVLRTEWSHKVLTSHWELMTAG